MTTVVVVDDHTLMRQSIVKLVASEPGFQVLAEAGSGAAAVEAIERHQPDLVLLDIGLPDGDGLEVASRVRRASPGTKILFLTMHDDEATLRGAVSVGADGYVTKHAAMDELVNAIRSVAGGHSYLTPAVARRVMDLASGRHSGPAHALTDRELEILRHLSHGLRTGDVADRLYVSSKTVKNHLTSVYAKLGVSTAAQAVAEAYRLGLVSPGAHAS